MQIVNNFYENMTFIITTYTKKLYVCCMKLIKKTETMTQKETLTKELEDLKEAFANNYLTVNEYSSAVYNISQQINKLS